MIIAQIDYGEALAQKCRVAGLTHRQTQVIAYACAGIEDRAIADLLQVSLTCVRETFRCAVAKLAPRVDLSREDRRAILDAVLGRKDRGDDVEPLPRGDWYSPARFQGARPFGLSMDDHREPNPSTDLLGVVCGLSGTRMPPLVVRRTEAPRRRKAKLDKRGKWESVSAPA